MQRHPVMGWNQGKVWLMQVDFFPVEFSSIKKKD